MPPKQPERKTRHTVLRDLKAPNEVLDASWQSWQTTGYVWVMTHGDVRGREVHLLVDYTVSGGRKSDVRHKVGASLYGRPLTDGDATVTQVGHAVRVTPPWYSGTVDEPMHLAKTQADQT